MCNFRIQTLRAEIPALIETCTTELGGFARAYSMNPGFQYEVVTIMEFFDIWSVGK